ncbi:MAG: protein of unknown function DUF3015 [Idiomarinaceae bacterium HL-53]|nr:MAG: protein of unknown function DUF3015 [Idiomarinaceae bacterium HL-53]CUS47980.1 Protein of unknown function (DUF3015) [Idiomarinaceae bacterium HL-53]
MKKLSMLAVAGVLSAGVMMAPQQAVAQGTQVNPWQHCGIGAMVFPDNGVAAAISNIIWDLGTTAVTSATVSPEQCGTTLMNVALLIDSSYDQLAIETAQGSGEHLNAALNLVGCAPTEEVVGTLRADLAEVASAANYAEMSHQDKAYSYYSSLDAVAANCGA